MDERVIAIRFHFRRYRDCLDKTLREILSSLDLVKLNVRHVHIYAVRWSVADWGRCIEIALYHKELPKLEENVLIPILELEQARVRYPFLFTDKTNPILYRQFH